MPANYSSSSLVSSAGGLVFEQQRDLTQFHAALSQPNNKRFLIKLSIVDFSSRIVTNAPYSYGDYGRVKTLFYFTK